MRRDHHGFLALKMLQVGMGVVEAFCRQLQNVAIEDRMLAVPLGCIEDVWQRKALCVHAEGEVRGRRLLMCVTAHPDEHGWVSKGLTRPFINPSDGDHGSIHS